MILPIARLALGLLIVIIVPPALGANVDSASARNIAAGCANCHGTGGVSKGVVPSLAGVPKAELLSKMQEFKNGKRGGTIMPQLAKGYTDEQIDLVTTWFAAQPAAPTK